MPPRRIRHRPLPSLDLTIHCIAPDCANIHSNRRTKCRELNAKDRIPLDGRAEIVLPHSLLLWTDIDDIHTTTNKTKVKRGHATVCLYAFMPSVWPHNQERVEPQPHPSSWSQTDSRRVFLSLWRSSTRYSHYNGLSRRWRRILAQQGHFIDAGRRIQLPTDLCILE